MLPHLSCMVTILMYAQCNLSFEESNKVDLSKNILMNIRSHEFPLQKCIPLNIWMPDTSLIWWRVDGHWRMVRRRRISSAHTRRYRFAPPPPPPPPLTLPFLLLSILSKIKRTLPLCLQFPPDLAFSQR